MKKIVQLILSLFVIVLTDNSYAGNGDSVMNAPSSTSTPNMSYQAATTSSGNLYSYTYVTQYQTSTCPAGLTVNGSSIYNSAQRQIISSYLGSQLVSTQTTAWTDIDTDCSGTQTQVIACPTGYTGTITQQRKIGTTSGSNGALQYDPWVTTANNCTLIPVEECPPLDWISSNGSAAMIWAPFYQSNWQVVLMWKGEILPGTSAGLIYNTYDEMVNNVINNYGYRIQNMINPNADIGLDWFGLRYAQLCKIR